MWRFYTINEKRKLVKDKNNDIDEGADDDMGMQSDGLWKCVGKLPHARRQTIYTVHCAPSRAGHGRIVSGGGDDSIHIYREISRNTGGSVTSSEEAPLFVTDISVKNAHGGDVNCVRWHPLDGSLLASAGDDGLIKIWKFKQ